MLCAFLKRGFAVTCQQCWVGVEQNVLLQSRNASSQNVSGSNLFRDQHYEMVKNQDFGPVLIRDSKNSDGSLKSTFEYAKRTDQIYDGVPYHQLPIARISARWNNTLISMKEPSGKFICHVSCRSAGFFNAKKKTELAGEATGQLAARKATTLGCHNHVRVLMKGIGPGRKPSINGLEQGGMTVVSITDITPLTMDGLPQRPRKIRRL